MPVIDKIESWDKYHTWTVIMGNSCEINIDHHLQGDMSLAYVEAETKIEAAWKAIIEFINNHTKW